MSERFARRQVAGWACACGVLTLLLHLRFIFRYDLYFGSDMAVLYLEAKRMLLGEFAIFQWGSDYVGIGPIDLTAAGLFALFGSKIYLASLSSLLFWSLGIGLLVALIAKNFSKRVAIAAGGTLAIGLPYFAKWFTLPAGSTYNMMPLDVGGFMLLTVMWVERGAKSRLGILAGFLMGWFFYVHKQVLSVWISIGVTLLLLPAGREFLKSLLRSKMVIFVAVAFLVGFCPEIAFRTGLVGHEQVRAEDTSGFFGLASPSVIAGNFYMLFRSIPTYFDADPMARATKQGVDYLTHMENWESFPRSASDVVGIIAACLVAGFVIRTALAAYREKNLPVLMLAMCPLVVAALILISSQAKGSYYSIRRYFLPGGLCMFAWMGVLLGKCWEERKWAHCAVIGLTLGISAFHQLDMLQYPDELADYRSTVADIEAHGLKYGASWYSYCHTLTALSNERVIFGIVDRRPQSPYQQHVVGQEALALVWPAASPPPFEFAQQLFFGGTVFRGQPAQAVPERVTLFGNSYARRGEIHTNGALNWAEYRKAGS